jgi:hypothetical protein
MLLPVLGTQHCPFCAGIGPQSKGSRMLAAYTVGSTLKAWLGVWGFVFCLYCPAAHCRVHFEGLAWGLGFCVLLVLPMAKETLSSSTLRIANKAQGEASPLSVQHVLWVCGVGMGARLVC